MPGSKGDLGSAAPLIFGVRGAVRGACLAAPSSAAWPSGSLPAGAAAFSVPGSPPLLPCCPSLLSLHLLLLWLMPLSLSVPLPLSPPLPLLSLLHLLLLWLWLMRLPPLLPPPLFPLLLRLAAMLSQLPWL